MGRCSSQWWPDLRVMATANSELDIADLRGTQRTSLLRKPYGLTDLNEAVFGRVEREGTSGAAETNDGPHT
jgi:hypothetical protein